MCMWFVSLIWNLQIFKLNTLINNLLLLNIFKKISLVISKLSKERKTSENSFDFLSKHIDM